MKQIGLATIQYSQDCDERLPLDADRFLGRIYPYVKSAQVYSCPSDANPNKDRLSYAVNTNMFTANNKLSILYAPALTVMSFEATGKEGDVAALDSFGQPKPMTGSCNFAGLCNLVGQVDNVSDTTKAYLSTGKLGGTCLDTPSQCTGIVDPAMPGGRHFDGSVFLMADGHAKWFRGEAVSAGGSQTSNTRHVMNQWYADGTNNLAPGIAVTFSVY